MCAWDKKKKKCEVYFKKTEGGSDDCILQNEENCEKQTHKGCTFVQGKPDRCLLKKLEYADKTAKFKYAYGPGGLLKNMYGAVRGENCADNKVIWDKENTKKWRGFGCASTF